MKTRMTEPAQDGTVDSKGGTGGIGSTAPQTGGGLASGTMGPADCSLTERCSCKEGSGGDTAAE